MVNSDDFHGHQTKALPLNGVLIRHCRFPPPSRQVVLTILLVLIYTPGQGKVLKGKFVWRKGHIIDLGDQ